MMADVTQISLAEARQSVDVGILTIKTEEFRAVLQRFPIQFEAHGKIPYNISPFVDASGKAHAAAVVRTSEQGDISAQATAASLIEDLRPNLIVVVGIAGASPEREFTLGDVIVANRMYNFTVTAANPDGTIGYATRSSPAHLVAQTVAANIVADSPKYGEWYGEAAIGMARPVVRLSKRNFTGPESWQRKVRDALAQYFGKDGHDRQPIVFDGPIASASTLMKDPVVFMEWLDKVRDLKAVDMEVSGVFEAARSIKGDVPVIVIRGLSDVVGFRRDSAWTDYACHTAASFCRALITSGTVRVGLKQGAAVGVAIPQASSKLLFIPISGVNFVRLGQNNDVANGHFTFSLRLNLIALGRPFILLGFEADYIAPDGCYCLNLSHETSVKGDRISTAGNDFDFTTPIPIPDEMVQITYGRDLQPPLMIQTPADCDYGDVRVRVKILREDTPEIFEQFFRFQVGGDLTPIDTRREPPSLSDSILRNMLSAGRISQEEFDRASVVDATWRYQIVKFGDYIKDAYSQEFGNFRVTDAFRTFLRDLHGR
jgi:nucleoside phosphorylase